MKRQVIFPSIRKILFRNLKAAMEEKNGAVARLYESMGSAVECNLFVRASVREVWLVQ